MNQGGRFVSAVVVAATVALAATHAATPPDRLHYHGVLRDAADAPLDGTYNMSFRFFDAEAAGNEILRDRHVAANGQAIDVTNGLFSVAIGSGQVMDGGGPGTYLSLAEMFQAHGEVFLEIRVDSETLVPRVHVLAAAYALEADHAMASTLADDAALLGGRPPAEFIDISSAAQTKLGALTVEVDVSDSTAITGLGRTAGGYFEDINGTGSALVGFGSYGIKASGNAAGGKFEDTDGSGVGHVGHSQQGIWAKGNQAGGFFEDADGDSFAYVANDSYGIEAIGDIAGGYFGTVGDLAFASVATSTYGIHAMGDAAGGYFEEDGSGYAYTARGNRGIDAGGEHAGGHFSDTNNTSYAYVADFIDGIVAYGEARGGFFVDQSTGTNASIAYGASSTAGTGIKNFVQNHPYDPGKLIYYAAIEGDEAATYTRGHARLEDGVATVRLSESFEWVTNPDIGLTAHVTARSAGADLYVERVTTRELTVRAEEGSSIDAAFDYLVQGLRIGFEDVPVVRVKPEGEDNAVLPSLAPLRSMVEHHPELRSSTALARFREMSGGAGEDGADLEMTAAQRLVAAIGRFDPALHTVERRTEDAPEEGHDSYERSPGHEPRNRPERTAGTGAGPLPPTGSTLASNETSSPLVATDRSRQPLPFVPVFEPALPGDLLVADARHPGAMRPSSRTADPAVIGVATGRPGRWDGTTFRPIDDLASDLAFQLDHALERRDREGALVVWAELEARHGPLSVPFASTGIVRCKVTAGDAPIAVGDLLATGLAEGHAARASGKIPGTVFGKALEPWTEGRGEILVLVTMQ